MRVLGVFILFAVSSLGLANTKPVTWPFDQRQILLIQVEGEGVPEPLVMAQLMDSFSKRGRVRWVHRKSTPGQILPVEVPKDFPWNSSTSIRQLGLRYKADGVLVLTQKGVLLQMRWYATADGQPLFYESLSVPNASDVDQERQRKQRIQDWSSEIWDRIPGQGYVVRRDLSSLSLEGAEQSGMKVGDRVELKRLLNMARHPLLKTLTTIDASTSGMAEIKKIESGVAVADIVYESKIDPIQEGDRYQILVGVSTNSEQGLLDTAKKAGVDSDAGVVPVGTTAGVSVTPQSEEIESEDDPKRGFVPIFGLDNLGSSPEAGAVSTESTASEASATNDGSRKKQPFYKVLDVNADLFWGRMKYQESVVASGSAAAATYDLADWSPGFQAHLRAYATSKWLLLADVGMALVSFGTVPVEYGAQKMSSGMLFYQAQLAWRQLLKQGDRVMGEILVKGGFGRLSLSHAVLSSDVAPAAKVYSGLTVGVGVRIPVIARWQIQIGGNRMMMTSLTETPLTSGGASVNTVWDFEGVGRYELSGISDLYFGLKSLSASSVFSDTGTRVVPATSTVFGATLYHVGYEHRF